MKLIITHSLCVFCLQSLELHVCSVYEFKTLLKIFPFFFLFLLGVTPKIAMDSQDGYFRSCFYPIFCWWDYENARLPSGYDPVWSYLAIKTALGRLGYHGNLRVEMVAVKENLHLDTIQRLKQTRQDLEHTSIGFIPADHTGSQASDDKIRVRVKSWAKKFTGPGVVVLIASDSGYAEHIRQLRGKGFITSIIYSPSSTRESFTRVPHFSIIWEDVIDIGLKLSREACLEPYYPEKILFKSVKCNPRSKVEEELWRSLTSLDSPMLNAMKAEDRIAWEYKGWNTLIEKTYSRARFNIEQIRQVYDAFLSNFPL